MIDSIIRYLEPAVGIVLKYWWVPAILILIVVLKLTGILSMIGVKFI